MLFVRFQNPQPLPWSTRILMVFGAVLVLSLLFFFAFTFFVIALIGTVVGILLRLVLGSRKPAERPTYPPPHFHQRPTKRDDDVIDI